MRDGHDMKADLVSALVISLKHSNMIGAECAWRHGRISKDFVAKRFVALNLLSVQFTLLFMNHSFSDLGTSMNFRIFLKYEDRPLFRISEIARAFEHDQHRGVLLASRDQVIELLFFLDASETFLGDSA